MTFFSDKNMMVGMLFPILLYLAILISLGVMLVYGFILLVRFIKVNYYRRKASLKAIFACKAKAFNRN